MRAAWAGRIDTLANGAVHVANPEGGLWDPSEVPTLVEELRIGSPQGEGPEVFGEISLLDVDALGWRQIPVKGNYFRIAPRHAGRIGRLVYPVPPRDHSSLGVHLCVDLAGGSLHKRGYRVASVDAPMQETVAAAILAAFLSNTAAGGVLVINVNDRSAYMVITTGIIKPSCP